MRYETTIKYKNNSVKVKVTYKALSGIYQLPEFLIKVNEVKQCTNEYLHQRLDWPIDEIEAYQEGTLEIPQDFLNIYCDALELPKKIKNLGVVVEKENKKILCATIQQIRVSRAIPQYAIASYIGVPRSTYACYETGKITPDIITLWKLADYYKISIDELIGRQ